MQDSVTWAEYLGRFHPVAVHFPIALLPAAALADVLCRSRNREHLAHASRFCVTLGALGALLAAPLGWMSAASAAVSYEPAWLLTAHRWSGIATAVFACMAAAAAWSRHRFVSTHLTWLYRGTLYAAAAAVATAGHFGGLLTYGEHYFSWGVSP